MSLNISKINPHLLDCLRQMRGDDANSGTYDAEIQMMDPTDALASYCAWEFGDASWAQTIIAHWNNLLAAEVKNG